MDRLADDLAQWNASPDWDQGAVDRYREGVAILARLLHLDVGMTGTMVAQRLAWRSAGR